MSKKYYIRIKKYDFVDLIWIIFVYNRIVLFWPIYFYVIRLEKYITQYPIDGNNEVSKPKYENGKVYINETQYFDNVPEVAWNFFIGGYQPAQKWLKDRKERTLEFEDILHYQKIIVALKETDRLMNEIDKIEIE